MAAIAIDTSIQIFWKLGVLDIPETTSPWAFVTAMAERPVFLLVLALMLAQLINWVKVLALADLSFAKPICALSYVTVSLVSYFALGEKLHPVQIAGIFIIVIGVWFVSRGGPTANVIAINAP